MSIRAVVAVSCLAVTLLEPPTRAQVQAPSEQPTFRTATRLATFDAVVTDAEGRPVTDLSPAERRQSRPVRQVRWPQPARQRVRNDRRPGPASSNANRRAWSWRSSSTTLNIGLESSIRTRGVLTMNIDTLVAPGDLVVILRASGGSGDLQQFDQSSSARCRDRDDPLRPRVSPTVYVFVNGDAGAVVGRNVNVTSTGADDRFCTRKNVLNPPIVAPSAKYHFLAAP